MKLLRTEDLCIKFGGLTAVNEVNIDIDEGEIVGLIGPNGSGKTTFFNLITGVYKPSKGKILFRNKDITKLPIYQINREGIARTFQNRRLFLEMSVLDTVLVGMHCRHKDNSWKTIFNRSKYDKEIREDIEKSFEILGSFSEDMLKGYFRKAKELSEANKRKLEICRALASEPSLLLLDEPSAGMNPEETYELMEDIAKVKKRNRDISIIIVEHDMSVIKGITNRVVVLNYGRKIAEGDFKSISRNSEVRKAYLGEEGA